MKRLKIIEEPIPHPTCFGQIQQCIETRCWDAEECQNVKPELQGCSDGY